MTPNPDYNRSAYILAIAQQVERDLLDRFIDGDTPAKDTLKSERVILADSEVTQAAFHEFLGIVRSVAKQAEERLNQYELRKRGEKPFQVNIDGDDNEAAQEEDESAAEQGANPGGARAPSARRRPRAKVQAPRGDR